jgi:PadR family transcriptional regulator, regulatory protein PadR
MGRGTRSDGPRMTLQTLAVLQAMLQDPAGAHYGLEISKAVGFPTGTIYPILARLERARWVSSDWENVDPSDEGRPRRRLYMLTGEGAATARTELRKSRLLLTPAAPHPADGLPYPDGTRA